MSSYRIDLMDSGYATDTEICQAVYNLLTEYARETQQDLTKDILNSSRLPRLNGVNAWTHRWGMRFKEMARYGPKRQLEPLTEQELADAEHLWSELLLQARDTMRLDHQEIADLAWVALQDLRTKPRWEQPLLEHYIEIAYLYEPEMTAEQIRQRFIQDWQNLK